jgi:hypothetical protein
LVVVEAEVQAAEGAAVLAVCVLEQLQVRLEHIQ